MRIVAAEVHCLPPPPPPPQCYQALFSLQRTRAWERGYHTPSSQLQQTVLMQTVTPQIRSKGTQTAAPTIAITEQKIPLYSSPQIHEPNQTHLLMNSQVSRSERPSQHKHLADYTHTVHSVALRMCRYIYIRDPITYPQERMMTSLFFHGGGRACDWQKFETGGISGVY